MPSANLSQAVVEAVADEESKDPVELPEPLYDAVDPDALDSLFRNGSGFVRFHYLGYRVTVTADADVDLAPSGDR